MKLRRQWKLTENCLRDGYTSLPVDSVDNPEGGSKKAFREYLKYNELELALDELEGLGNQNTTSKQFWTNLWNAARFMRLESHINRYSEIIDNWPKTKQERRIDEEIQQILRTLHHGSRDEVLALASPYDGNPLEICFSRSHKAINVNSNTGEFTLRLDGVSDFPSWIGDEAVTLHTNGSKQIGGEKSATRSELKCIAKNDER